jgi:hypothetical protein
MDMMKELWQDLPRVLAGDIGMKMDMKKCWFYL